MTRLLSEPSQDPARSCQNSQRVHHETPASTQTAPDSNRLVLPLTWQPVCFSGCQTRSSRSAPSSPDSKRLNLSRFGFYHLCFSSPGQHCRHGNIRNKLHSNNNHQTAVKQLRLCFSLQTVTSSLISVFMLQSWKLKIKAVQQVDMLQSSR